MWSGQILRFQNQMKQLTARAHTHTHTPEEPVYIFPSRVSQWEERQPVKGKQEGMFFIELYFWCYILWFRLILGQDKQTEEKKWRKCQKKLKEKVTERERKHDSALDRHMTDGGNEILNSRFHKQVAKMRNTHFNFPDKLLLLSNRNVFAVG